MFHPWAPGAAFWLAKGTTLYNTLANYMRERAVPRRLRRGEDAARLQQGAVGDVRPLAALPPEHVPRRGASGDEQMAMKAMNCPGHFLVFGSEVRSYRDLPLRLHEQTPLHRNEASGVLSGLTRVRQLSQDDAHCFVMESQIAEEVERLLRLMQRVYDDFGLPYSVRLSTRPAEFLGTVETWDHAEASLKAALERAGQAYTIDEGDGAFYGPEDRRGRDRRDRPQVAVRHVSARLPDAGAVRPEVHRRRQRRTPAGGDPSRHLRHVRAVHRTADRAFAGAWPLWLAPVQVVILPIADRHRDYAVACADAAGGGRACESSWTTAWRRLATRSARLSSRRSPTCWSIGDREAADGTVAVRSRTAGDLGARSVADFIAPRATRSRARRSPRSGRPHEAGFRLQT